MAVYRVFASGGAFYLDVDMTKRDAPVEIYTGENLNEALASGEDSQGFKWLKTNYTTEYFVNDTFGVNRRIAFDFNRGLARDILISVDLPQTG